MGTRLIECNGEVHSLKEWAEIIGISYQALSGRLKRGWSINKAVNTPKQYNKTFEYNGQSHTIKEWAEKYGLSTGVINWRLNHGWSMKDALKQARKYTTIEQ